MPDRRRDRGNRPADPSTGRTSRDTSGPTRERIVAAAVAVCSVVIVCSPEVAPARPAAMRPNVLIAVFDTTRADRWGPAGYERGTTPTLDALAGESTVYLNAWSPAGWTSPAHGSLLTGLRPESHGGWLGGNWDLRDEIVTVPELVAGAGYRTACVTPNPNLRPENGLLQGFRKTVLLYDEEHLPRPIARESGRRLLEWIGSGEGPWFALVNYFEPHVPYDPPDEDAAWLLPADADAVQVDDLRRVTEVDAMAHNVMARVRGPEDLARLSDLYDAEISIVDREFGQLVEELRQRGTLDETLLIVVGDHGENLGEHGLMSHHYSLHATIRRIPLLIRYPSRFGAGVVERRTVRLEDVAPTVLEVCGVEVPTGLDAASLLGNLDGRIARAVLGPPVPESLRQMIELRPPHDLRHLTSGFRAVFDGRFHLIESGHGEQELYDLAKDPGETNNLARTAWEDRRRLTDLLPSVD